MSAFLSLLLCVSPNGEALSPAYIFPVDTLHNHSASIAQLPDGSLLAAWYRGSGEGDADDVRIMGARKPAGPSAWSEPVVLADTRNESIADAALDGSWLRGNDPSEVLAFPGAEGYGRFARGGRGGDVYAVTTLADDGPGSLREGLRSAKGPRTIVFDTGGTIELKSSLRIEEKSHITIAGQTAPGDGITLKDWGIEIKKSSHLILRYLRLRLGDQNKKDTGPDTLSINYSDNIMLDHLSLSWAIDGIQDTRGCANYTMQWCIMSEALHKSIHPEGAHAMCGSFRGPLGNMSLHHNVFATSRDRHPTLGGSTLEPAWLIDFRNNVIYNWSGAVNVCDNQVLLINNFFKPGPETDPKALPIAMKTSLPDQGRGWMSGNVFAGRDDLTADNYAAMDMHRWIRPDTNYVFTGTIEDWKQPVPPMLGPAEPATESAQEAYDRVLAQAGASRARDAVDKRVLDDIKQGTGNLIDSQDQVGGWPVLKSGEAAPDSDGDGMPDAWERVQGFDPDDGADGNLDADGDGFTNLEEYLADLVLG